MTTEERLENLERELARTKRRNRWLVVVAGLVVVGLILGWTWIKITATAQAQQRPRPPIDRNQLETLEEHEAAQNAIELATMKRQCDEMFNAAYRAASKVPDKKNVLAIFDQAEQAASRLQSKNIRVQNAYSEYLQSTLASQEDRFARLAQAVGGADETVPPPAPYGRPQHETPEKAVGGTKKTIRANAFIVEDENGKARALLGIGEGVPALVLLDENGKARALLGIGEGVPELVLLDENGKKRAVLGVNEDGPRMQLFNPEGKVIWAAGGTDGVATTPRQVTPPVHDVPPPPAAVPSRVGPSRVEPTAPQWRTCPACAGSGTGSSFPCSFCNGTGKSGGVMCSHCNGRGFPTCPRCNGKGMVSN